VKSTANQSAFIALTAVIVCAMGIVIIHFMNLPYLDHQREGGTFLEKLRSSPPNEIGDTLAGIFGSLAFLAAAFAVFMQSFELKAQREELRLSRDQFREMAEAQQKQVSLMRAQGRIFEDEQEQRREDRAEKLLSQLLDAIPVGVKKAGVRTVWLLKTSPYSEKVVLQPWSPFKVDFEGDIGPYLSNLRGALERFLSYYEDDKLVFNAELDPENDERLAFLIEAVGSILQMQDKLSQAQRQRVANLEILELDTKLMQYQNYYFISRAKALGLPL